MKTIELTEYNEEFGALSSDKIHINVKHISAIKDVQYRCVLLTTGGQFEVLEHPHEIFAKIAALDEDEYVGDGD